LLNNNNTINAPPLTITFNLINNIFTKCSHNTMKLKKDTDLFQAFP
jgi:hypothetical protein